MTTGTISPAMSPNALTMSKLTPLVGHPLPTRLAFYSLRLLAWSNGMEAFLCCVALAYAAGFMAITAHPAFVTAYPLAYQVAWIMLITGGLGVMAVNMRIRWLRIATSLAACMAWFLLSFAAFGRGIDLQPRLTLVMGVLALGELAVFVRLHLGMDAMSDTLDAAAFANNLEVAKTGTPLPATKQEQGNDGATSDRS